MASSRHAAAWRDDTSIIYTGETGRNAGAAALLAWQPVANERVRVLPPSPIQRLSEVAGTRVHATRDAAIAPSGCSTRVRVWDTAPSPAWTQRSASVHANRGSEHAQQVALRDLHSCSLPDAGGQALSCARLSSRAGLSIGQSACLTPSHRWLRRGERTPLLSNATHQAVISLEWSTQETIRKRAPLIDAAAASCECARRSAPLRPASAQRTVAQPASASAASARPASARPASSRPASGRVASAMATEPPAMRYGEALATAKVPGSNVPPSPTAMASASDMDVHAHIHAGLDKGAVDVSSEIDGETPMESAASQAATTMEPVAAAEHTGTSGTLTDEASVDELLEAVTSGALLELSPEMMSTLRAAAMPQPTPTLYGPAAPREG